MRSTSRVRLLLWLCVLLGCGALHLWTTHVRLTRLDAITGLAQWSVGPTVIDARTPTGYADARRAWLAPGRSEEAFPWILETQVLVTGGDWRVRRVDHDNAPTGRSNHSPLLYRLWLGTVAWVDHLLNGSSLPLAAERAARWADPALSLLFLIAAGLWIGRTWGGRAACVAAIGWTGLFPLGTAYLPGAPDPGGLAWICLATSLLGLVAAARADRPAGRRRTWAWSGMAAGLGLSLELVPVLLVVFGAGAGALVHARLVRRRDASADATVDASGWRLWALCGAATALGLLALENLPAPPPALEGRLHPVHALAWLGWGELLTRLIPWIQTGRRPSLGPVTLLTGILALGLIVLAPLYHGSQSVSFAGALDPLAGRLSPLTDLVAGSWTAGLAQEGARRTFLAVLLPWGAAVLALGIWAQRVRRGRDPGPGLLALGAALPLLALTWTHLSAFAPAGAGLWVLATVLFAREENLPPVPINLDWLPPVIVALAVFPGLVLQWPPPGSSARPSLDRSDVEAVVERDLAFWLAKQAGDGDPAIVLASPAVSAALTFHGGLRAVASLHPENEEGLRAALRIARATSPDEALALLRIRQVRYVVLPSWDRFLETSARVGTPAGDASFIGALRRWVPLTWLRPLPYRLPKIGGFEQESVVVLEVVDEQPEPRTLSLQAEYFLDMGWTDLAAGLRRELQRFPADLGARIALIRVEGARNDGDAFAAGFSALLPLLNGGADRMLAWDRRVSLATLLAQGQRLDLAEVQVRRTLKEVSAARLRSLSAAALFRWLSLARRFGAEIPDPNLRQLALDLLPPDLVARLKH
ncbi:MAG: hypothetical protein JNJ82_09145 [Opitutaceae bacterium]|nr:hypothetical protein [Opitutaceae bacterium]